MMPLAAINWHATLFLLFALLACGFAVAVVATSNIVRMAFYLTLSLGATSGLFFLAGSEFVGAMQLMIYVGGTLVLLIFGVMLTAQARFISMKTSAGEWVMAAVLGSALLLLLLRAGFSIESWNSPRPDLASVGLVESRTSTPIGLALSGIRVDKLDQPDEQLRAGMSGYLLPFVIVSMHLLVVLIGAGYMARSKRAGTGLALERPAAAVPRVRKWTFPVTAGIVSGVIMNALLAAFCFAWYARPASAAQDLNEAAESAGRISEFLAGVPPWLWLFLGALFLANVLLLVVVYLWQRWGVIGLVAIPIIQALAIANADLGNVPAIGFLVVALAPVVPLIVLLCSGRRPTLWSQMD